MRKIKYWIKYICYFIIGFLIVTILASISQVDMLKELKMEIDIKTIFLHTIKSEFALYTIIYFLILVLNVLYNIRLIKKLNEESKKIRKIDDEKILKERREFTMRRKILISVLVVLIIFLIIFGVNTKRKSEIFEQYTKAVEQRDGNTNYYAKIINKEEATIEMIGKDNIKIYRQISKDGKIRMLYQEGDKMTICITEPSGKKTAINVEAGMVPGFNGGDSYFDSIYKVRNILVKIKSIIETKITTENLNGKECYRFYVSKELQAYVNKEDMVSIKKINGSSNMEYVEYKFGTVTDEDINKIKPNLEEYIFQED